MIHKHVVIKSSDGNATKRTVAGKEREVEEGEELSDEVMAKLKALVHADTERVCVLAAILLCSLDKRDNQVSHSVATYYNNHTYHNRLSTFSTRRRRSPSLQRCG